MYSEHDLCRTEPFDLLDSWELVEHVDEMEGNRHVDQWIWLIKMIQIQACVCTACSYRACQ